jgi:hypothetical protein
MEEFVIKRVHFLLITIFKFYVGTEEGMKACILRYSSKPYNYRPQNYLWLETNTYDPKNPTVRIKYHILENRNQ